MVFVDLQLLFSIFVLLVADIGCQKLSIHPDEPQIKLYNSGAIFTCELTDFDVYRGINPVLRWKNNHDDWIRDTSGRVYIEREDIGKVKLYITEIQDGDEGMYQCQADVNGETLRRDTHLLIYEEIRFEDTPRYLEMTASSSPLLECVATGQPVPTISWRFNRRKIPNIENDDKYRYETGGLRIFNINASDNGTYECRAEVPTQANFQVKTIVLDVRFPPIIDRGPQSRQVIEGDSVELQCDARGNPDLTYDWELETDVAANVKMKVELPNSNTPIYTIHNIQRHQAGLYFCIVSNDLGTLESSAQITVLVPPHVKELPNKNVSEGQTFVIPCEASGDPVPAITWIKEGSRREYDHNNQPNDDNLSITSAVAGMSKLSIYNAQRSYSGQYTCIARNSAGEASQVSQITVEYAPTANISKAELLGWSGQVRDFRCTAHGLPLPSVNWVKGGQPIFNSDVYTVTDNNPDRGNTITGTLKVNISEAQPRAVYGTYECIAKNKHGTIIKPVSLTEATPPAMPQQGEILESHTDSVVISCKPPAHTDLPITRWRVEFYPQTEPQNITILDFDGFEEKFEITDLPSGEHYQVAVSAGNEVGFSEALKFAFETKSEITDKQQQDIPFEGNDHKYMSNNQNEDVKFDKASQDGGPGATKTAQVDMVNIIGITVGILVIFLLIILIIVFLRRRHNKNQGLLNMHAVVDYKSPQTVHVTSGADPDDLQLNIINHQSYQEVKGVNVKSPLDTRRANGTGTLTRKTKKLSDAGLCTTDTRGVEQARMWESTLQRQKHEFSDEDSGEGELVNYDVMTIRSNPMAHSVHSAVSENEWPPPPSPDTCTLSRSGYGTMQCTDNTSYHAVLDGYMSGENVDEDDYVRSPVQSPLSVKSPNELGRVPSDYEQSSYQCYDPIT